MSIVHNPGRQYELTIEQELKLADLATECVIAKLPPNATITNIQAFVDTAFNAGTTNTLSVGDSGSATRYLNAATVAAVGPVAGVTGLGHKYTTPDFIRVQYAQTGAAATAGVVRVIVRYLIGNRANEAFVG